MIDVSPFRVAAILFVSAAAAVAQDRAAAAPPEPIAECRDGSAALSAYCTDLVPTPDLRQVVARLHLKPAPNPFGVAVTREGHARYLLSASITGLPSAASLGRNYRVYVAWATTLSLDREIKLGELADGRTELGEIALDQFRVLVTAERSAAVDRRSGRLVLRAVSPTARLLVLTIEHNQGAHSYTICAHVFSANSANT